MPNFLNETQSCCIVQHPLCSIKNYVGEPSHSPMDLGRIWGTQLGPWGENLEVAHGWEWPQTHWYPQGVEILDFEGDFFQKHQEIATENPILWSYDILWWWIFMAIVLWTNYPAMWAPSVIRWFRFTPLAIVISTINHSYWSYKPT